MSRRLFRSRDDRMLAGVAGGLAELWDADPSLVRIVWAVLVPFTGGIALLVYVVMALVVPEEEDSPAGVLEGPWPASAAASGAAASGWPAPGGGTAEAPPAAPAPLDARSMRQEARAARRAARRNRGGPGGGGLLVGVLLVIAGVYFLVREYVPDIDVNWLGPILLVVLGVVVLVSAFRRPPAGSTGPGAPR